MKIHAILKPSRDRQQYAVGQLGGLEVSLEPAEEPVENEDPPLYFVRIFFDQPKEQR